MTDADTHFHDLVWNWLRNNADSRLTPAEVVFALLTYLRLNNFGHITIETLRQVLSHD